MELELWLDPETHMCLVKVCLPGILALVLPRLSIRSPSLFFFYFNYSTALGAGHCPDVQHRPLRDSLYLEFSVCVHTLVCVCVWY